jgi:hypothetical protein
MAMTYHVIVSGPTRCDFSFFWDIDKNPIPRLFELKRPGVRIDDHVDRRQRQLSAPDRANVR